MAICPSGIYRSKALGSNEEEGLRAMISSVKTLKQHLKSVTNAYV